MNINRLQETKHIGILIGVLVLLGIVGGKKTKTGFDYTREYIGFWAESQWSYTFKSDGTYILETAGHVGGGTVGGFYLLKDSIVILIADRENFEDRRLNQFRIDKQGCLRDYVGYFYCESEEQLNNVSERRDREKQILRRNWTSLEKKEFN